MLKCMILLILRDFCFCYLQFYSIVLRYLRKFLGMSWWWILLVPLSVSPYTTYFMITFLYKNSFWILNLVFYLHHSIKHAVRLELKNILVYHFHIWTFRYRKILFKFWELTDVLQCLLCSSFILGTSLVIFVS